MCQDRIFRKNILILSRFKRYIPVCVCVCVYVCVCGGVWVFRVSSLTKIKIKTVTDFRRTESLLIKNGTNQFTINNQSNSNQCMSKNCVSQEKLGVQRCRGLKKVEDQCYRSSVDNSLRSDVAIASSSHLAIPEIKFVDTFHSHFTIYTLQVC